MALGNKTEGAKAKEAKTEIKTAPEFDEKGAEATAGQDEQADAAAIAEAGAAGGEVVDEGGPAEEPAAETSKELATAAPSGALATNEGRPVLAFADLENALPNIDFGILSRFHGANGTMIDGENNEIGKEITLDLLSWRYTYLVTPNSDSDESDDFVKYSDDGVHLNDTQELITDYIASIKAQWPKTSIKKYVELTGMLISSDIDEAALPVPLGDMFQISMSPQSRKLFEAHRMQMMVKFRMGRVENTDSPIKVTAKSASWKKNNFTKLITSVA